MWQAEQVRQRLAALYPGMALNVLGLPGPADRGAHLAGAARTTMIRDLESAMAEGRAVTCHPVLAGSLIRRMIPALLSRE